MMFALAYDAFNRRLKNNKSPVTLNLLSTCQIGTPAFNEWSAKFLAEDNNSIEILVEDDKKTYSFFEVIKPIAEATGEKVPADGKE